MEDWVLADTLIWASFFSKPDSPEKRAVDDLIDADRVVLIGPIVAEVLALSEAWLCGLFGCPLGKLGALARE